MIEQKFSILIVEDQRLVARDLAERLKQAGYDISGIADNYDAAIALFDIHKPDLVLLDINIRGEKNGIAIATQINKTLPTPFIFVTAQTDSDTLQKAKNTFPSAYLVKPFTTSHLSVSIDLALHNFAHQKKGSNQGGTESINSAAEEEDTICLNQDFIFVKDGHTYIKIDQKQVSVIESQGNYIKIHTTEKNYLIRCTINSAIEKMKQPYFVRVHRSFCVNINKITKFDEHEISLGKHIVPIGRNYREDFVKKFDLE